MPRTHIKIVYNFIITFFAVIHLLKIEHFLLDASLLFAYNFRCIFDFALVDDLHLRKLKSLLRVGTQKKIVN